MHPRLAPVVLAPLLCAVVVVLSAVWPLFYTPTPSGETCWTVTQFTSKRRDCDCTYPDSTRPLVAHCECTYDNAMAALPGAPETDENFSALYALYVACVAASALGFCMTCRAQHAPRERTTYAGAAYGRYLRAMLGYFCAQLAVSAAVAIAFAELRCHYHNLADARTYYRVGATTTSEITRGPPGAAAVGARVVLTVGTAYCAVVTNAALELVLLRRAEMLQAPKYALSARGSGRAKLLRALKWAIIGQLVALVGAMPWAIHVNVDIVTSDGGDAATLALRYVWGAFGVVHVAISALLAGLFLLYVVETSRRVIDVAHIGIDADGVGAEAPGAAPAAAPAADSAESGRCARSWRVSLSPRGVGGRCARCVPARTASRARAAASRRAQLRAGAQDARRPDGAARRGDFGGLHAGDARVLRQHHLGLHQLARQPRLPPARPESRRRPA